MSDITLRCSEVVAGYGDVEVLHGVSIEVRAGTITALLRNNGAGKTTSCEPSLACYRRVAVRSCTPGVQSRNLLLPIAWPLGSRSFRKDAWCFRNSPSPTIFVLAPTLNRARKDRLARTEKMYEMFPRLRERRWQMAGALSGGEQQMLALARGLMSEPTLLLLDEPSLGLAPQIAEQMFQTIAKIRDGGHSILIVEQDIAGTLEIADYGYVMENGRITIEGEPALLRNNPQVLASYLGGHVS